MDGNSVWVGVLDLDRSADATGVSGPLHPSHQHVKLLVRMHHAPVGYVEIPAFPRESLADRARKAAAVNLLQATQWHTYCDDPIAQTSEDTQWDSLISCPRRFAGSGKGLTVVVCTRDRPDELRDCLDALRRCSYEPLEIMVVDNAPSSDATRTLVSTLARADPRVHYIHEPVPGLSRARNLALINAQHELVAFTDDDTLVDSNWPAALAAGFGDDLQTLCVTGFVAASALETSSERYFGARYSARQRFEPYRYDMNSRPTKLYPYTAGVFGMGANFAVRRDAIVELGGFDPLLGVGGVGRGGEDLDIFLRVILAGGSICYMPSALVWHRHRVSAPALREQIYSYGHGLGAYIAKHLSSKDLQTALLAYGFHQIALTIGAFRRAAMRSQLGMKVSRYALTEVGGVIVGALSYWRAAAK